MKMYYKIAISASLAIAGSMAFGFALGKAYYNPILIRSSGDHLTLKSDWNKKFYELRDGVYIESISRENLDKSKIPEIKAGLMQKLKE